MFSNPLIVVGTFLLVLVLMALLYGVLMQRRRGASNRTAASAPDWVGSVSSSAPSGGERLASVISEQIEDLVRSRIQADPALQGMDIDFGTSGDGGLEIWLDGVCYTDIASIPDTRIQVIIQGAVAAYNQGEA